MSPMCGFGESSSDPFIHYLKLATAPSGRLSTIKRWDFSTGHSKTARTPTLWSPFGQSLLHNLKSVTYLDLISWRGTAAGSLSEFPKLCGTWRLKQGIGSDLLVVHTV